MTDRAVVVGPDGRAKAYRPIPEHERMAAIAAGLTSYERGDYFEAHEELEPAWMGTDVRAERALLQGIIKVAAAYVHDARGNPAGIARNLTGARTLLLDAAASFDWVIIDTPPVLLMPDANLVSGIVDAVVLVIAAGRTPHDSIQRTIAALGRDRIIGVVLNRVAGQEMTGSQYESYYGGQDGVVKAKRKK